MDNIHSEDDTKRSCWVCFLSEADDPLALWCHPCHCKGTTQWVHLRCLQRWIDEKQKGNTFATVKCPQCNADYIILYPPLAPLLRVLERMDRMVVSVCPLLAAGTLLGGIYWCALSYGATSVLLLMGMREGKDALDRVEPILLLIGLPTIPLALIMGKMIRWEDHAVRLITNLLPVVVPATSLAPPTMEPHSSGQVHAVRAESVQNLQLTVVRDQVSLTRIFVGALAFPIIAHVVGKAWFTGVFNKTWQRTVAGGALFVVFKGVFRVYFKYCQIVRQARREIRDYYSDEHSSEGLLSNDEVTDDDDDTVSIGSGRSLPILSNDREGEP